MSAAHVAIAFAIGIGLSPSAIAGTELGTRQDTPSASTNQQPPDILACEFAQHFTFSQPIPARQTTTVDRPQALMPCSRS